MENLIKLICRHLESGEPVALAELIAGEGSAPRGPGSRLLADREGLLAGTVGGGLVEAQTLRACSEALKDGAARLLDISLTGEMASMSEMICGGRIRVLASPLAKKDLPFFLALRDAMGRGGAFLITDISDPGAPARTAFEYKPKGRAFGASLSRQISGRLLKLMDTEAAESTAISFPGRDYVLSRCLPPERLFIVGGGHISRPTAQVAALAGFSVTVMDDRPEFSRADRFPWAGRVLTVPEYRDCFSGLGPDNRTAIAILTRGHLFDAAVLKQALETEAGYIGMIGSLRKRAEIYAALGGEGVPKARLNRVRCPIGLPLAAETPEEIAVSIVAECIAWRQGVL